MAKLDFCVSCGSWIAANMGTIRQGPEGGPEIICDACLVLEQNRACPLAHDAKSGSLDDG